MTIEICFKDHAFTPITMTCYSYNHNSDHKMFFIYMTKDGPPNVMIPDNAVNYIRTVFETEDVNKEETE